MSYLCELRLPVWFRTLVSVAPGYLEVPATVKDITNCKAIDYYTFPGYNVVKIGKYMLCVR